MKLRLPSEFLYQVFALLFAVIVVHAAYVGVIRPSADSQLAVQAAQQAAGEAPTGNRSLAIVIKDYEQEACFNFDALGACDHGAQSLPHPLRSTDAESRADCHP